MIWCQQWRSDSSIFSWSASARSSDTSSTRSGRWGRTSCHDPTRSALDRTSNGRSSSSLRWRSCSGWHGVPHGLQWRAAQRASHEAWHGRWRAIRWPGWPCRRSWRVWQWSCRRATSCGSPISSWCAIACWHSIYDWSTGSCWGAISCWRATPHWPLVSQWSTIASWCCGTGTPRTSALRGARAVIWHVG